MVAVTCENCDIGHHDDCKKPVLQPGTKATYRCCCGYYIAADEI